MKAFVTGGTGFIGSHLVDSLLNDNTCEEVRCLVRSREKWLQGKPYTRIEGDMSSLGNLKKGLEGTDTLFHIAAVVKAPTEEEFTRANVHATENIVRLAIKAGVKKIVVLSSLAAAGPSHGLPRREDEPSEPVSMYGKSKKKMEQAIHEIDPCQASISIIRPPVVYGPRETQVYSYFKIMNKRICPIVGDGENPQISMVHVSDLVKGIRLAAGRNGQPVETYYVSGPEINNWNQIKNITSKVLGKKPVPLYIRPGVVKQLAGVVESAASVFGIYPVFNREKANEMVLEWTCSNRKATEELHYTPDISLEEGISQTIRWYKKHHWL